MMSTNHDSQLFLAGQLLVAMPTMADPRFAKSVIYICAHSDEGAMGLVVNQVLDSISFPDLLEQLGIEPSGVSEQIRIHRGGPVESGRGFVLHSAEYVQDTNLVVDDDIALTATVQVPVNVIGNRLVTQTAITLGTGRLALFGGPNQYGGGGAPTN